MIDTGSSGPPKNPSNSFANLEERESKPLRSETHSEEDGQPQVELLGTN